MDILFQNAYSLLNPKGVLYFVGYTGFITESRLRMTKGNEDINLNPDIFTKILVDKVGFVHFDIGGLSKRRCIIL